MIQYEDFSIRIESKRGNQYPVRVLRSPAGEGASTFQPAFNLDDLGVLLADLGQTVRGTGLRDAALAVTPGMQPKELGHQLYSALFSGSVRSLLDSSRGMLHGKDRGLRIKLHIDPEDPGLAPLASLPWELLYRKKTRDFLSLSHSTPVVRYLDIERPYIPLALQPPLRILVVVSSPAGYEKLDLNRERELIEQSWAHQAAVEVDFMQKATIQALQDRLSGGDVHVLHFMGHGDFDEPSGQGVLLMEDSEGCGDVVDGHALGVLLHDARTLRLVVLNACETARVTARQYLDPFAGIATALILAGIPAVVAMQFPISDGAAITFAERFYPLLAKGRPVDYAITEARKAIYVAEPDTLEWATPVLFMRSPQGILFEVREAHPPQVTEAEPLPALFDSHLQPRQIAEGEPGRVTVQNLGDRAEIFLLTWQDPAQELGFDPAQAELSVPQGQSASASFSAAPRRRRWIGGEKAYPFTVQVTAGAKETQTHTGEVASKGLIPLWILPLAVAALALLSLLLYFLIAGPAPSPVVSPFSDHDVWGGSSHYETIHSADIDGDGVDELLGRGKEGMEAYQFIVASNSWELVADGGPFGDESIWDKAQYYETIHSGDIDGDGAHELLGRGEEGMEAYRFDSASSSWELVADGGPFGDEWIWGEPQYYETIQSGDVDGDGAYELLGRGIDGMQVWGYNGSGWKQIADPGLWSDAAGWAPRRYYVTIHAADIDGDGVDELLGRSVGGIDVWRFHEDSAAAPACLYDLNSADVDNDGVDEFWCWAAVGGPFKDGTHWEDHPKYYATIQSADIDGDGVDELLGRGPSGVQVYAFKPATNSWELVTGTGPFENGNVWDELKHYVTIHSGDIDGDGVDELLGLGPSGMEAYRFGWMPVATKNW